MKLTKDEMNELIIRYTIITNDARCYAHHTNYLHKKIYEAVFHARIRAIEWLLSYKYILKIADNDKIERLEAEKADLLKLMGRSEPQETESDATACIKTWEQPFIIPIDKEMRKRYAFLMNKPTLTDTEHYELRQLKEIKDKGV